METQQYKVLTNGIWMVDSSLLHKGIYETRKPYLYKITDTKESLVETATKLADEYPEMGLLQYIANLQKCELITVQLSMI